MNMKKEIITCFALFVSAFTSVYEGSAADKAHEFVKIPSSWKWISAKEAVFTYDGTYTDSLAFSVNARSGKTERGVQAPEKYTEFPLNPEGAVNLTYSPDSTKLAFTRENDIYVADIASGKETRLTFDGTDLILNGYASWVYYEEILGRPSKYRAFWWSPDSKKIGFYRFDNTEVPLFPIYSPFGQDGKLNNTRYPKAGEKNPEVRIGIVDVCGETAGKIVWADFDEKEDQYFGIPFWGADSKEFYIARMPRLQNTLQLYAVSVEDGSGRQVYKEHYPTWIDWITSVEFTEKGMYMARRFETGWEQLYFLSYDGKDFRRLTDGENWGISIIRLDEKSGELFFTARRDARVRETLYRLSLENGEIRALTDPAYSVSKVKFSPEGKYFIAEYSNYTTPARVSVFETGGKSRERIVADMAYEGYNPADYALPELIWLETEDGLSLPAAIVYPKGFDRNKQYPVHMDIYGGPDTPLVKDRWTTPSDKTQWWSENGIIQITADCRAAGHNGRAGTDMVYKNLTEWPVRDFISWAEYLQSLPYVKADKIGVEGFSFGGTMTSMLLFRAPDKFHYGIAGGGVYDWALYDSHYTERYMETPQSNPDGYKASCALEYVDSYPVVYGEDCSEPVLLKLTHGTGDDNVHFQNTLQLIDVLQKSGKKFDFMIYPDGMHGYRGDQQKHFIAANREFWLRHF